MDNIIIKIKTTVKVSIKQSYRSFQISWNNNNSHVVDTKLWQIDSPSQLPIGII